MLLVLEVGEKVPLERDERVGDRAASAVAVVVGQRSGGCLDGVQIVGHSSVLGAQTLDNRADRGIRLLELAEEVDVFRVMVEVNEAAPTQAADLELPEHAVASQCLELLVEPFGGQPVDDGRGETFDAGELAADVGVDGEEHPVQLAATVRLRGLLECEHGAHSPCSEGRVSAGEEARRSATRSRTSWGNVLDEGGEGRCVWLGDEDERAEAQFRDEASQNLHPVLGRADDGLVGVGGRPARRARERSLEVVDAADLARLAPGRAGGAIDREVCLGSLAGGL